MKLSESCLSHFSETIFHIIWGMYQSLPLARRHFPVLFGQFIAYLNQKSNWHISSVASVLIIKSQLYPSNVYLFISHCVKNVQMWSFFWSVFSCIQSDYRKIRTRKNSVLGHFSCSVSQGKFKTLLET